MPFTYIYFNVFFFLLAHQSWQDKRDFTTIENTSTRVHASTNYAFTNYVSAKSNYIWELASSLFPDLRSSEIGLQWNELKFMIPSIIPKSSWLWGVSDVPPKSCFNSICQTCLSIAFGITNISDADKRLCPDHPHAPMFPRSAVGKLHGLSIKDALRSMPVARVSSTWKWGQVVPTTNAHPESGKTQFENTFTPRFSKRDIRNVFLECDAYCFQTKENTSIHQIYFQTSLQMRLFCYLKTLSLTLNTGLTLKNNLYLTSLDLLKIFLYIKVYMYFLDIALSATDFINAWK